RFVQQHQQTLTALNLATGNKLRVGPNSLSLFFPNLDAAAVMANLKLLAELIGAISREPKPARRMFDREWILKTISKPNAQSPEYTFGGELLALVVCNFCGERTNLMAQIDLSDSALPKTASGKKKLPI